VTASGPALYILGGIALRGVPEDGAHHLLAQSKAVALLVYLALAPAGRYQRRDRLVGLLWPELDQGHARAALRKAIHEVRSALGGEALVTRGDEELALAQGALWCDAVALEHSAEAGQLARAVELYRGDLMLGFHLAQCAEFDQWLQEQRGKAVEQVVAATWALARAFEADSRLTDAAKLARDAARLDWTNERVLRRSLLMLERLGDRAGALRLFDVFARRLQTEFGAEPSPETIALVARLRSS
jgi:serine/threonine-protein kinase